MPSASRDKHFNVAAFLKSMGPSEVIDFFGIEIPVPTDTPLSYTLRAQEIQESSAEDAGNILKLLADVLGQDIADQIEELDPGIRALGALLLWAFNNASGEEMDFPAAYEKYLENEASSREQAKQDPDSSGGEPEEDEGKAAVKPLPNRSDRRAATRSGPKSEKTSH
ncbi:hypothetical protein [Actinopolyspora halophila]|uniref:hypothetical protein n=1 Tax=Actinopolyspora halophila TaxID=1850 RepID=UPI000361E036|nr:hypothetical protein [Actinopolyspora halophila]